MGACIVVLHVCVCYRASGHIHVHVPGVLCMSKMKHCNIFCRLLRLLCMYCVNFAENTSFGRYGVITFLRSTLHCPLQPFSGQVIERFSPMQPAVSAVSYLKYQYHTLCNLRFQPAWALIRGIHAEYIILHVYALAPKLLRRPLNSWYIGSTWEWAFAWDSIVHV